MTEPTRDETVRTFSPDAAVHIQPAASQFAPAGCLYVLITDGSSSVYMYLPTDVADRLCSRLAVSVAEAKAAERGAA